MASLLPLLINAALIIAVFFGILIMLRLGNVVRYIPNSKLGLVEKLWSMRGSVTSGLIALNGEAGFQPEVVRGGLHFFWPFTYRVHLEDLITIGQGEIGYVFARDGDFLEASQALGQNDKPEKSDFTDVRMFLQNGGQRGPQRKILREGTYAINTMQFAIITKDQVYAYQLSKEEEDILNNMKKMISARGGFNPVILADGEDQIGVVTVHDGPSLPTTEIIAPEVGSDRTKAETFHNNFQDPEKFLVAGGYRGRQLHVLTEGTWYINRLFASVEKQAKSIVPVGSVGVVVWYTGPKGEDASPADYHHGELVPNGCRGVWKDALLPGKYAFNMYAGKLELVPTVNFILKWVRDETQPHALDENLDEISLITKDAFEPKLPLSVVAHIDYEKAPMIIQRFGDIKKLVEQTLDPMISAYFKNIGQTKTLIQLLQDRSDIQDRASTEMKDKFLNYSLELHEVLIGTPRAPQGDQTIETILLQLRQRQIAHEQVDTFQAQSAAQVQARALEETKATAAAQADLTKSQIAIRIQENEGAAALARAGKEAEQVKVLAAAAGEKSRLEGQGEADRILAIGTSNATSTKLAVDAYGGPEYRLAETNFAAFCRALTDIKQPVVPQFLMGAQEGNPGGLIPTAMLSTMFSQMMPAALAQLKEQTDKKTNSEARH